MFNFLTNLIFPNFCLGCNKYGESICKACFLNLKLYCKYVYKKDNHKENITKTYAIFILDDYLKKIIIESKYKGNHKYLEDFLNKIDKKNFYPPFINEINNTSVVIQPVPLSTHKKKIRGFNQSAIIAKKVQEIFNYRVIDCLKRRKQAKSQVQAGNLRLRKKNIEGVFYINYPKKIDADCVILIDDVVTTGETLNEAALTIKKHNNKIKIYGLTLAHKLLK